jgi:hypothetical protein
VVQQGVTCEPNGISMSMDGGDMISLRLGPTDGAILQLQSGKRRL